ncbi:hypothetical protein EU538_05590 [Candidatus Thorarchaeota archaeon]|nr:MAG: hypothetical protein EU538_05590 [Candidatus Thorarchaeota archaeon]
MNGRMSAFDMHSHSFHSKDGMIHLSDFFPLMKSRGLRGMALTEHEKPSILKPIHRDGRFLLNGCEFKSTDYGELIGLFISEPIRNRSFVEIAEDIHDQNGITILPHPRDPLRKQTALRKGLPDELIVKHVDLIEGINSRCFINFFNVQAQNLAKRLNKPMTAGSDGHSFLEVGHAKTWLQDIEGINDIYEALKQGKTQISGYCSLPFWHIPTILWQRVRKLAQ